MQEVRTISFVDFSFFVSLTLLIFTVWLLQCALKNNEAKSAKLTKLILLIYSMWIIAAFDWRFLLCITGTALISYASGIAIEKNRNTGKKKYISAAAVILLAGMLCITKYFNSFMHALYGAAGGQWNAIRILVPVGISFYTLSAIGYILDTASGKIEAEHNFLDMMLFLMFFPKLVCGPIASARDFLPQLKENKRITGENFQSGIQIVLFGAFKKLVIADRLALFVNQVFDLYMIYSTGTVWLAVFTYFLELYFDFSGYSDMAVGISRIFGYKLPVNFDLPFSAANITDFWNRWHISLTSWLTEYIFNPTAMYLRRAASALPKEKRKKAREYMTFLAIFITFVVSGLWHGTGLTYLIWGICHAFWSVIHAVYATYVRKHKRGTAESRGKWLNAFYVAATFFFLNLIEVIFRAESMEQAGAIYRIMFRPHPGITHMYLWTFLAYGILGIFYLMCRHHAHKNGRDRVAAYYPIVNLSSVGGLTVFFVMLGITLLTAYFGPSYFIYGVF